MIKQIRVSEAVSFFKKPVMQKYNLREYTNPNEIAIFKGVFRGRNDIKTIEKHRTRAVILWCGTDALSLDYITAQKLNNGRFQHIAISGQVERSLAKVGIKSKRVNFYPYPANVNPVPLGEWIYTYIDPRRKEFYGYHLIQLLRKELPFHIEIIEGLQKPREEIFKIYEKCFIGLRLTQHDGLSNTVVELGLMGRRSVWNNTFPGAYHWTNFQDIKDAVEIESKKIGSIQKEQAFKVYDYLAKDEWLNEDYYDWD